MRFPVVLVSVLAAGIVVGGIALRKAARRSPATETVSTQTNSEDLIEVTPGEEAAVGRRSSGIEKSTVATRGNASGPATTEAMPDSARPTQQILNDFLQNGASAAPLTKEQADGVNAKMRDIVAQGNAGLPAIRGFLSKSVDLSFAETDGIKTLKFDSLRSGLLDALREIGSPEATAVQLQVLKTTADPREIAQIASNLEDASPGEHRPAILDAARETLALAAKHPLSSDAAPLFRVLQGFDDASSVPVLEEAAPQFKYYSALALAKLPDGQGVSSLIRLAQSDEKPRSNLKDFALVTLSQVFDKSPDAQQALVTEAQRNTISDSVWRLLGKSLSGEQMQIGEPQVRPDGGISNLRIPGITTYHNEANNQNFWSASAAPSGPRRT